MTTIPITKAVDMSTKLLDAITETLDANGDNVGWNDRFECAAENLSLEQIETLTLEVLDDMVSDTHANYEQAIVAEVDRLQLNAKEERVLAEIIYNRW